MRNITLLLLISVSLWGCNDAEKTADAYGNFEAVETIVSSEAGGKILSLDVFTGDILKKGEPVGLIDTVMVALRKNELSVHKQKIEAGLRSIESQAAILKQQKENLMVNQLRIEKLFESKSATQKQLDDINGAVKVAVMQIRANRAKYLAMGKELEVLAAKEAVLLEEFNKCTLLNPVNGTVLEKYAELGELTAVGKPIYKIANLKNTTLKAYISGGQLSRVKIGGKCRVKVDNGDGYDQYQGKVVWVSPQAEFTPKIIQTKDERVSMVYAIKIDVPNDGRIKIGMPGEAVFE